MTILFVVVFFLGIVGSIFFEKKEKRVPQIGCIITSMFSALYIAATLILLNGIE